MVAEYYKRTGGWREFLDKLVVKADDVLAKLMVNSAFGEVESC